MSQVPTYVQIESGVYLKNPVIYQRNWFICFDDSDDPELVVKISSFVTGDMVAQATKILKNIDILAEPKLDQTNTFRDFSRLQLESKFEKAANFFFKLSARLPDQFNDNFTEYSCSGFANDIAQMGECLVIGFPLKKSYVLLSEGTPTYPGYYRVLLEDGRRCMAKYDKIMGVWGIENIQGKIVGWRNPLGK